jgi:FixJ family two-component response regulator
MAHQFTIAVIDNDESIRRALQRLLRCSGYAVETFSSAEEFMECHAVDHTDCLLVDVHLAGASGLQLQRSLVDTDWHLPTVFITSHQDEHSRQTALRAGAADFLCKPFDTDTLLQSIQRALERRDARDRGTSTELHLPSRCNEKSRTKK